MVEEQFTVYLDVMMISEGRVPHVGWVLREGQLYRGKELGELRKPNGQLLWGRWAPLPDYLQVGPPVDYI